MFLPPGRLLFAALAGLLLSGAAPAPKTVVVLYFDNRSDDRGYDVLSKGLADMLVTDLSGVAGLTVLEREKLQELVKELDLQKTRFFDPTTAQKLGKGIGATHAVAGSLAAVEPRLRLDIRLIEVASGKVVMGDHVTGHKDQFFALEEELVKKFVGGLSAEGASARSGAGSLGALLEYAKGIDAADRGDLKAASSQMAKVVSASPTFVLAKERYTEILQRLHGASRKRQDALASVREQLLENADAFLAGKDIARLRRGEDAEYFGYRVVRGQYLLHLIGKRVTGTHFQRVLGPKEREEALPLLRAFYENTATMIDEVARWQASPGGSRMQFVPTRLKREDEARAKELKIEDPGDCLGCPRALPGDLALWTVGVHSVRTMPITRPALFELDPSYGPKALALLEPALERAFATQSETGKQWAVTGALDVRAQVLLALGRKEEAMAAWQEILDRYPTSGQFERIEENIKGVLGVSKAQVALEAALTRCDMAMGNAFGLAATELLRFGGAGRMREQVALAEKRCAGGGPMEQATLQTVYSLAMSYSANAGACALFQELAARPAALKLSPTHLGAMGSACR